MVKVTDRFYINATTNSYILQEKTKVKDENSKNYGQEIFKDLGYYTTLENCLRGILKTDIREYIAREEQKSIADLQKHIRKAEEFLESLKLDL